MNDFIKGDTSLIKDLIGEVNRLQNKVAELTNSLNSANLQMANKEQQRLDTLNDNKYYKNLCLELTQKLTEKDELLKQKISKMKSTDFIKMCVECGFMVQAKEVNNQIVIAELNKVKELMTNRVNTIKDNALRLSFKTFVDTISNAIDQRINMLKGEPYEVNE